MLHLILNQIVTAAFIVLFDNVIRWTDWYVSLCDEKFINNIQDTICL